MTFIGLLIEKKEELAAEMEQLGRELAADWQNKADELARTIRELS